MGKGFNNYMCKKFFHPASRDNLKRVWMAEQKSDAYKKKQEELRVQYEKEQDLHDNKAMLSKDSKDKLSINFMYEPPPGMRREREREENEPEYKFEWQRKYNAPRESYCKGDSEIRDQPFGIQVRNVRCIKCHKWGHINTDKECPLYSMSMSCARTINEPGPSLDQNTLVRQMFDDGLALKKNVSGAQSNHQMVVSDSDDERPSRNSEFIASLTTKQKKKLLKRLEKLERKSSKSKKDKKKKRKHKSKSKSSSSSSESSSGSSESDSESEEKKKRSSKHKSSDKHHKISEKTKNGIKKEHSDSDEDIKKYRKEALLSVLERTKSDKKHEDSDRKKRNSNSSEDRKSDSKDKDRKYSERKPSSNSEDRKRKHSSSGSSERKRRY